MRFNPSQVAALAILHCLLGGFILLAIHILEHPVAEWVLIPIFAIYLELKIWHLVRSMK